MSVVDQAMRRYVAPDVASHPGVLGLDEVKDLLQRPLVEVVFQHGGAILGVGRRVLRYPVLAVEQLPLALEPGAITAPTQNSGSSRWIASAPESMARLTTWQRYLA